jgi:hypothetical protein
MTKKDIEVNYPKFKPKLSCAYCLDTVERRSSNQIYCKIQCRARAYYARTLYSITCEVCNTKKTTRGRPTKTCSKFCADVMAQTAVQVWTDPELIHLALLNPGVGIKTMMATIYPISWLTNSFRVIQRMHDICAVFSEENDLNLLDYLEDPSKMIEIPMAEYLAEHGVGDAAGKNQIPSRYTRLRGTKYGRTNRKISISPPLNWGPYKPRQHSDSK